MPAAGSWSPWAPVGTPLTAAGPPAVTVAAGVAYVVTIADDVCMYTMASGRDWTPWANLGGIQAAGRPVLLAVPGEGIDVLARDTAGTIQRRRISQVMVTPWEVLERRSPGPVAALPTADGLELAAVDAGGQGSCGGAGSRRRCESPEVAKSPSGPRGGRRDDRRGHGMHKFSRRRANCRRLQRVTPV